MDYKILQNGGLEIKNTVNEFRSKNICCCLKILLNGTTTTTPLQRNIYFVLRKTKTWKMQLFSDQVPKRCRRSAMRLILLSLSHLQGTYWCIHEKKSFSTLFKYFAPLLPLLDYSTVHKYFTYVFRSWAAMAPFYKGQLQVIHGNHVARHAHSTWTIVWISERKVGASKSRQKNSLFW